MNKMIADIYIRVSTMPQTKGGGLDRQKEECIKWCKKNNIAVRHLIQDICSAFQVSSNGLPHHLDTKSRSPKRGNLGRYLETVHENPPNFFVVEDWDRLNRSSHGFIIISAFQKAKVNLVSVYREEGIL